MVLSLLSPSDTGEYRCLKDLNLYVSTDCQELSTQAGKGRHIKIISQEKTENVVKVIVCEDNYPAWLKLSDLEYLQPATIVYQARTKQSEEISSLIPKVVEFTHKAMSVPNYYLWGGTVAPNYDCSGLMQCAFASAGIWLPRDSYQQEDFTQRIDREELTVGDLIFFGETKVNHVALYLGDNQYIHSSGTEYGNNGIGINTLAENIDRVSTNYYKQLWSFGRVTQSFIP